MLTLRLVSRLPGFLNFALVGESRGLVDVARLRESGEFNEFGITAVDGLGGFVEMEFARIDAGLERWAEVERMPRRVADGVDCLEGGPMRLLGQAKISRLEEERSVAGSRTAALRSP